MIDERDFDFITPEFFDDGTLPEPLGPTAEDMVQQMSDPTYVSEYLKKQRAAEKEKTQELIRRRQIAIMGYSEFAAQDNGYFHCPENVEVMFRSLRNGKANPQCRFLDYSADGFNLAFELARKKSGLLDLGPNRGYTRAQIDRMSAQEERDKVTYPKPKELLEEEEEIRQQKAKAATAIFQPSSRDQQIVWGAAKRSGKVSLSGLMSLLPSYTREECAAVADSIPDLLCVGMGNRKTWWPR
jgi:hypothetical protein